MTWHIRWGTDHDLFPILFGSPLPSLSRPDRDHDESCRAARLECPLLLHRRRRSADEAVLTGTFQDTPTFRQEPHLSPCRESPLSQTACREIGRGPDDGAAARAPHRAKRIPAISKRQRGKEFCSSADSFDADFRRHPADDGERAVGFERTHFKTSFRIVA